MYDDKHPAMDPLPVNFVRLPEEHAFRRHSQPVRPVRAAPPALAPSVAQVIGVDEAIALAGISRSQFFKLQSQGTFRAVAIPKLGRGKYHRDKFLKCLNHLAGQKPRRRRR